MYHTVKKSLAKSMLNFFLFIKSGYLARSLYRIKFGKFSTFIDIFFHRYNSAFPIKIVHVRDTIKTNWVTQGIKISIKKMWLLNNQRKMTIMKNNNLEYIEHYKKIYRKVIKEANRRENNSYINSAKNKSKAAWHVINKELGIIHILLKL